MVRGVEERILAKFYVPNDPQLFFHYDGRPYRRGWESYLNFETRSDWNVALTSNYTRFDDQTDSTYGVSITKGISNRFPE